MRRQGSAARSQWSSGGWAGASASASEAGAAGASALVHELDVTDATSVDETFAACERELGVVDVVVDDAGISTPGWAHEVSTEAIAREVAANLVGPMLVTRPTLTELGAGRDPDELADLLACWPRSGLQPHRTVLEPLDVAHAVVTVTTRPGVLCDTPEIPPEAPRAD